VAECGSRSEISLGWWVAPGRLGVAEASRCTLRVVNVLVELLGSLNMYDYPYAGQILTTTLRLKVPF